MAKIKLKTNAQKELIIDSFAGGGGASLGITWALGRGPDVAINHEPKAIAMHLANHPKTRHLTEDVFKSDPRKVTNGKKIGLLWASPDCTHHSRAKGGKPVKKEIRGLAWVVIKWAGTVAPRVIVLENVREFEQWGPLCPLWHCSACQWKGTTGQAKLARRRKARCPQCESTTVKATAEMVPNPLKKGITFKQFVGRLKALGYHVEWQVLNAADFGAPTHRRRLFLVARNDGQPIVWPDATHGDPKTIGKDLFNGDLIPWRTAAECIDWSIPCPSIFLTPEEGKKLGVRRPLKPNTLKRIALGIKRYVLDNPRPFIVVSTSGNPPTGVEEPLKTATTGNHHYLVTPTVLKFRGDAGSSGKSVEDPVPTVTAGSGKRPAGAGHGLGVCSPILVPVTHGGERRANRPEEPLPTVTGANRGEMAVVAPVLTRLGQTGGNGSYANSPDEPVTTITSKAEHILVAPVLAHLAHGEGSDGRERGQRTSSVESPVNTVHAGGNNFALVTAFIAKHFGGVVGHGPERPLGTVTAVDHHSVVAANLVHLNHGDKTASGADEPARTVTASGNHAALVYSFLTQYTGESIGTAIDSPVNTNTRKARFGVVTVVIDGQEYAIVDIGMRMLRPRELARAQGFPDSYILKPEQMEQAAKAGNLKTVNVKAVKWGSNSDQVESIGNSVSPYVAKAVVAANCADLAVRMAA